MALIDYWIEWENKTLKLLLMLTLTLRDQNIDLIDRWCAEKGDKCTQSSLTDDDLELFFVVNEETSQQLATPLCI